MLESFNLFWFMISIFQVINIFLIPAVIIKCSKKTPGASQLAEDRQEQQETTINKSTVEIINNTSDKSKSKSEKEQGSQLDLSNIRDSIRVAKLNQHRNSPKKKNDEPVKVTKTMYTKSGSEAEKSRLDSKSDKSIKFISVESLTDEIVVPIGHTSRAAVPQSSLTSINNLKTHGQPRSEVSVKFGTERISTKRTKPLSEAAN